MIRHLKNRASLAVSIAVLALALPGRAAEIENADTALKLMPADTAFYGSMLRNREQIDAIAKSNAWAKLMSLPAVKYAQKTIEAKLASPDEQTAAFLDFFKQPENKELLEVLGDAVSDEIFVYGGVSWVDFFHLLQRVNLARASAFGNISLDEMAKPGNQQKLAETQARFIFKALTDNVKLIRVPDFVLGFKVRNAKKAEAQVKRLEDFLNNILLLAPPTLQTSFQRVKVGDSSVLNFTLDGSLVPWDKFHIKDYEENEGDFDPLLKKLAKLKLAISLGVHKGYFVLAIGGSTDGLAAIGGNGKRLNTCPEFKPLAKFAERSLTSVGYASKEFARSGSYSPKDFAALLGPTGSLLDSAKLPKKMADKLHADLKWLTSETEKIPTYLLEPGATLSFSFRTESGSEGYSYDYGTNSLLDASEPLTLLDFAGGKPIFFGAMRMKGNKSGEKIDIDRVMELLSHVEEAALSKLGDEEKKKYKEVKEDVLPLLKRFYEITTDELTPSLDGQIGIVLDAKWKSKQWSKQMPVSSRQLTMPEFGLLLGIADADKFRKAFADYRVWLNDTLKVVNKFNEGKGQALECPPPTVEESKDVTLAFYPIPEKLGLDPRVVPTSALTKKVMVLTLSRGHTKQLLAQSQTPGKFPNSPLADLKQPLAAACIFHWPAFVNAAKPWIEMGIEEAKLTPVPPGPDGDVLKQVQTVLEVLKVFHSVISASYDEDGKRVTHTESVYRDLK